jgi:hypothetical protein
MVFSALKAGMITKILFICKNVGTGLVELNEIPQKGGVPVRTNKYYKLKRLSNIIFALIASF